MNDAHDAEDRRLLEAGEHRQLVDNYVGVIIERCTLRLRNRDQGIDAATAVVLRLMGELKGGKTYNGLPFRVVVHQVVNWVCAGYERRQKVDAELPVIEPGAEDLAYEDVLEEGLDSYLEGLTDNDREVILMRYGADLTLEEIAERLGIARNAVDQRLHRALKKIRRRLEGAGEGRGEVGAS